MQPSPVTRPVGLGFAGMFAAGGLLIMLAALGEGRRRRPSAPAGSPPWRLDHRWREVGHHENGTGQMASAMDRVQRSLWLLVFFAPGAGVCA